MPRSILQSKQVRPNFERRAGADIQTKKGDVLHRKTVSCTRKQQSHIYVLLLHPPDAGHMILPPTHTLGYRDGSTKVSKDSAAHQQKGAFLALKKGGFRAWRRRPRRQTRKRGGQCQISAGTRRRGPCLRGSALRDATLKTSVKPLLSPFVKKSRCRPR
jgi:hypothetical protein